MKRPSRIWLAISAVAMLGGLGVFAVTKNHLFSSGLPPSVSRPTASSAAAPSADEETGSFRLEADRTPHRSQRLVAGSSAMVVRRPASLPPRALRHDATNTEAVRTAKHAVEVSVLESPATENNSDAAPNIAGIQPHTHIVQLPEAEPPHSEEVLLPPPAPRLSPPVLLTPSGSYPSDGHTVDVDRSLIAPEIRLLAVEGRVVLRILVRRDGTVGGVVINQSSGHHSLDRAASEAAASWRFQPATRDGEAIEAWAIIAVRFVLH